MAKWTTSYKDSLPDSSFLLVLPGGKKKDGKTEPKSKRKFPVKDANGKPDKNHIDDALSRIPDSNISDEDKASCQAKAEKMLAAWKKEHGKMKKSLGTMSYDELRDAFQQALREKYGTKNKNGYWDDYPWPRAIYETEFVVEYKSKYYIGDYLVEDGVLSSIGPFYPAKQLGWAKASDKPVKIGSAGNVNVITGVKG